MVALESCGGATKMATTRAKKKRLVAGEEALRRGSFHGSSNCDEVVEPFPGPTQAASPYPVRVLPRRLPL